MFRLIQYFREVGFRDESVRQLATSEHLELIDALCVRNLSHAETVLNDHIERSKSNAISQLVRGEVLAEGLRSDTNLLGEAQR